MYVGETARSYSIRIKEHKNTTRKTLTAVGGHLQPTGHSIHTKECLIFAGESDRLREKTKETIYIYQISAATQQGQWLQIASNIP